MADSTPDAPDLITSTAPMGGPDVLPIIRYFGAALFLAGLAMLGTGLFHQWFTPHPSEDLGLPLVIMGPIILAMGGAAWFLVWEITLNRSTRRVTRRLGTWGIVKTTAYPFEAFTKVWLDRRMVESTPRFQVFLCGNLTGEKLEALLFTQSDDRTITLARAEAAAAYLGIPLKDTSSEPTA